MRITALVILAIVFCINSCNRQTPVATANNKLVLRFELDSSGNITNEVEKAQVIALGKELQQSADKVMMTAYTERSGNAEQDEKTAAAMARAVRDLLKAQGERSAYNVGVDIRGYQNPIDSINPANIINRRIEIVPM